uniref:F-box domain-containing protein n=1 Tax=Caenorhabditis tropicalis TaxID=1561998 RepID=A0A1I7UTA5_9PELO
MDLLRIPFIVLIDVFKYMNFREKFFISLLSKRARNTLKLTAEIPEFSFKLSNDLYIHYHLTYAINAYLPYFFMGETVENCCIGGEEMRLNFNKNGVILQDEPFRKQMILANHLLDSFRKPTFSVDFLTQAEPAFVLEFMKMINKRKLSIKSFGYFVVGDSSEFIPRILDECTEVTDYITVYPRFSNDFVYTSDLPFKANRLCVYGNCNWLNLESFMSCRCIILQADPYSPRARQSYTSFFTKWMDSDVRLEQIRLVRIGESENQLITDALNNEGTLRKIDKCWTELKRSNGSEFFIHRLHDIAIYSKQGYLEQLRWVVKYSAR